MVGEKHTGTGMPDRKGKGKEITAELGLSQRTSKPDLVNANERQGIGTYSLPSRVTGSAMALGASLVKLSDTHYSTPGKAGPSATSDPQSAFEASAYIARPRSTGDASFRSLQSRSPANHGEDDFMDFMHGVNPSSLPGHSYEEIIKSNLVECPLPKYLPREECPGSSTDGQEIVNLLDGRYEDIIPRSPSPDMPVSAGEAATLRQELFGTQRTPATVTKELLDWDAILDFYPEYMSNDASDAQRGELPRHLGTSDVAKARRIWIEHWGNLLNHYTDEVWGDFYTLAQQAREEIRKIQEGGGASSSDTRAIRRLRQIVAHVRNGQSSASVKPSNTAEHTDE